jgi:hypothetical protein
MTYGTGPAETSPSASAAGTKSPVVRRSLSSAHDEKADIAGERLGRAID